MASCLARRWVLVFFFLVSHINTGNTRCYSSGATSRAPRRNAASARASIILLQVLGRTGTSSIDPSARLRGGGPQDADGSSLGTGMLEADRLGKDDAGAAEERAGSGDGLRRSGDWSQKPKKKRSRRRQQMLNMRKDKRPESQKPRAKPLGLHLVKDGADTNDHSELVEEERMLRDSIGLAPEGAGVNDARVGLKRTEKNVGGDDDAMPGGKKDADRDEDRAVGLDPADRAKKSHAQSGRGGKREVQLRTRPVEDLNSEDGEDRLSAAALRRKSHKLRRMRKRWGADLKGNDPRDVVARELKTALEEQEAEEQQRAKVTTVRAENAFDWLSLGEGMAMFNRNQTVEKVQTRLELSSEGGRRPMGEFAIWGAGAGAGAGVTSAVASCSKWGLRIDKMQGGGDLWLGLLETPFRPAICKADRLATRAWMINDLGVIVRTGRAGREQLNGRASFKLPPPGAMAFRQGSIVVVTYKRHACTNSSALSELHLEVFQPGAKYEQQARSKQAHGKPAVAARRGYSRGTPPANAGAHIQPGQCLLQNIPATARPFVNLVHKGDSVSIIPRDGLVRALRQLRRARLAADSGELGASARGGSRKQVLKEQERLLRRQILNDGFDPFGTKAGGQVAEGVDKELHRDSLFEDSSSAGSLVSIDSLGADNDGGSRRTLFGGRGAPGGAGSKGETATPLGTNRVVDILTSAPIKKKWQQRGALGAQTLSGPGASSEVSEGSQVGEVDDITEWNSDQVSSSFAGGASASLPPSAGAGEPSSDADTAAGGSGGGWIRARAPGPVVVKMDIDDDECLQGVPVVKVKSQKAQARAREAEEAQGQRA